MNMLPPSPPPSYRFGRQDRITINGVMYVCGESDGYRHQLLRLDNTKIIEVVTNAEIDAHLAAGTLTVERAYFSEASTILQMRNHGVDWDDLDDEERAEIVWRQAYCDRFLDMEAELEWVNRSELPMTKAIAEIHAILNQSEERKRSGTISSSKAPPTYTTLLRWVIPYERTGRNKMALMSGRRRSGCKDRRLDDECLQLLKQGALDYLDGRVPSVTNGYGKIAAYIENENQRRAQTGEKQIAGFSLRALYREVDKRSAFHRSYARDGKEAAQKKFFVSTSKPRKYRPLERVEMDDWNAHLHTLLEKDPNWKDMTPELRAKISRIRMNVAYSIDVGTRCILGAYTSEGPTTASALRVLQMSVSNKTDLARKYGCQSTWEMCGYLESIVTDGGKNWVSVESQIAMNSISKRRVVGPAGKPQVRSHIERVFRTTDQSLLPYFTGRAFSNISELKGRDAAAQASIFANDFGGIIIRWIVDDYHHSEHAGLDGQTPYNAWLEQTAKYGIEVPPPMDQIRHIFGVTVSRAISGKGVRFLGLFYQSEALQMIRHEIGQQRVPVRVDQANLGAISVKGPKGWIEVHCTRRDMDRVSVLTWLAVAGERRQRFALEAKLTWPIVAAAIRDFQARGDHAAYEAGLESPIISAEELNKADRELFRTFRIQDALGAEEELEPEDIYVGDHDEFAHIAPLVIRGPSAPPADGSEPATKASDPSSTVGNEDEWNVE